MDSNNSVFFDTAWNIGLELVRDAIWDNNERCTWQGNWIESIDGQFLPVTRTFGADFYSGTSGIAYFLMALYSVRPDEALLRTFNGAIAQVLSQTTNTLDHGFYSGKPGIAFVLVKAGEQFSNKEWITAGLSLLSNLKNEGITPYEIDVISGITSTIPVLLQFGKKYERPAFIALAIQLGDELIKLAKPEAIGVSWDTGQSTRSLTGFSHGAAGMATSLVELYKTTNDKKYLDVAMLAFAYEQACFNATQQNWPDLRDSTGPLPAVPNCGLAWCHGAPGIALSRRYAFDITGNPELQEQLKVALTTTHRGSVNMFANPAAPPNYSLCHGAAGNADILLDSGNTDYIEFAKAVGNFGIQNFDLPRIPWLSGTNTNKKTPGLLMGLAGTGYFYLRLFDAVRFKSVLLPNTLAGKGNNLQQIF